MRANAASLDTQDNALLYVYTNNLAPAVFTFTGIEDLNLTRQPWHAWCQQISNAGTGGLPKPAI